MNNLENISLPKLLVFPKGKAVFKKKRTKREREAFSKKEMLLSRGPILVNN